MEWEGVPESGGRVRKGSRECSRFRSGNKKQALLRRAEQPGRFIRMKSIKEIPGWLRVIRDLEGNGSYFEGNALGDRKPVKSTKNGSDVIEATGRGD